MFQDKIKDAENTLNYWKSKGWDFNVLIEKLKTLKECQAKIDEKVKELKDEINEDVYISNMPRTLVRITDIIDEIFGERK